MPGMDCSCAVVSIAEFVFFGLGEVGKETFFRDFIDQVGRVVWSHTINHRQENNKSSDCCLNNGQKQDQGKLLEKVTADEVKTESEIVPIQKRIRTLPVSTPLTRL
jgi:hypothetical protein